MLSHSITPDLAHCTPSDIKIRNRIVWAITGCRWQTSCAHLALQQSAPRPLMLKSVLEGSANARVYTRSGTHFIAQCHWLPAAGGHAHRMAMGNNLTDCQSPQKSKRLTVGTLIWWPEANEQSATCHHPTQGRISCGGGGPRFPSERGPGMGERTPHQTCYGRPQCNLVVSFRRTRELVSCPPHSIRDRAVAIAACAFSHGKTAGV